MGLKEHYKQGLVDKDTAEREAEAWTLDQSSHGIEAYQRFMKWIAQRKVVKKQA
jgi:hypothetical protein